MFDAGDSECVRKHREKAKIRREQELEDIRQILSSDSGMRFFKRFFESGRVFQTTFTGNSQSYFLEGHRNFALIFLNDVSEACPQKITEILININKEKKEYE